MSGTADDVAVSGCQVLGRARAGLRNAGQTGYVQMPPQKGLPQKGLPRKHCKFCVSYLAKFASYIIY